MKCDKFNSDPTMNSIGYNISNGIVSMILHVAALGRHIKPADRQDEQIDHHHAVEQP